MNWVTENKFLAGFSVVLLGGVGTLGYLTYGAMGKYEDASGKFQTATGAFKNARSSNPNQATLNMLLKQKQDLTDGFEALQSELKARVPVVEPIKKAAFQEKLKNSVARIGARASEVGVKLPQGFYMGCEAYQSKTPEEAAATPLARQFRAIENIMDILLQTGGVELQELKRELLPEEHPSAKSPPPPAGLAKTQAGNDKPAPKLVGKMGFTVKFACTDSAFRQILNAIVGHKEQFFVIRNVELHNERPEPPPKVPLVAPSPPPPTPPGTSPSVPQEPGAQIKAAGAPAPPAQAPKKAMLEYIFGTERVIATLQIESLDFAAPEAGTKKDGKKKDK